MHFKWIQSPIHDEDISADNTPKKPHYHTLFMFEAVKTIEQVTSMLKELFGENETGSIMGVLTPTKAIDRCALVRYMVHLDDGNKAQYDVAAIIGHNGADPSELLRYSAT